MSSIRILFALALVAAFGLGAPVLALETPDQITDDVSGSGCMSVAPVISAAGTVAAWQSDCDPAGGNADGSLEIFRATVGAAPAQLTDDAGLGCSSSDPTISASGDRIAFVSSCNLTGENADGNVEIFLWKSGSAIDQLTHSIQCDNLAPSINGPGTFIAFDSTCNITGTSNDGRGAEIFRVSAGGALRQLTTDPNGGLCDSTSPSINDAGNLVAFDSDCDLVGDNVDLATEIYTVTGAATPVVRQRTFAEDDSCSSVRPSMDGDGSLIGFHSDCDFTGKNADRSDEIFTVTVALSPQVEQVTDVGANDACASGDPQMSSEGLAMTFTSYCKLNGSNGNGSLEVFQVGVGKAAGGIMAVTNGSNCSSVAGGIDASGTRVVFDSDCDPAGQNADRSIEVFRAPACTCGAPARRGSTPQASDALFALSAAVGNLVCMLCECDTNDDGQVVTSDSLRILKAAVGQNVELDCPVP